MKRTLLLAAAAISLGGCNIVYSETPLFSALDAQGAPALRPGVWAQRKDGCAFDPAQPVTAWPDCAGGAVISATHLEDFGEKGSRTAYVLAAGEPRVLQMEMEFEPGKPKVFLYGGLRVDRTDAQGRIVEAATWIAQCGPPPPGSVEAEPTDGLEAAADTPADDGYGEAVPYEADEGMEAGDLSDAEAAAVDAEIAEAEMDAPAMEDHAGHWTDAPMAEGEDAGEWRPDPGETEPGDEGLPTDEDALDREVAKAAAAGVTREPLPGLEIKDGMCVAREQGPVRASVAASRQWEETPPSVIYWVRDGER